MPSQETHHSEEAREIMGRMPSWMVRNGIGVIAFTFALILIGCWFIKYPEIIEAPIVLATVNPPADLVARYEGRIDSILIRDGACAKGHSVVAILENTADYESVKNVSECLDESINRHFKETVREEWLNTEYRLGDIQSSYSNFQRLAIEYRTYLDIASIDQKKKLLSTQIEKNGEYMSYLKQQSALASKEMEYAIKGYERDSMLFANRAIAESDLDKSARSLIQQENSRMGTEAGIVSTELNIMQMRQQIVELDIQKESEIYRYERELVQSRQELIAAIRKWREQYLLESPIEGRLTFTNYWSSNQRIKVGERLASVIPSDSAKVIGRLNIPSSGFGKIHNGQTVNVKLNGYPYMEFGILKGTITAISAVPDSENSYQAEVSFPNGLISTYNKPLTLIQQMDGTGSIITEDMRLIEQFVRPIKALLLR